MQYVKNKMQYVKNKMQYEQNGVKHVGNSTKHVKLIKLTAAWLTIGLHVADTAFREKIVKILHASS